MKLLLDTHAFIWFMTGDPRLSPRVKQEMENEDAEVYLSAASVWEIAIKSGLGRLALPVPVEDYLAEKREQGLREMSVGWNHAAAVAKLPLHHRDPFDRLLVAQSLVEDIPLASSDPELAPYGIKIVW